MPPPRSLAVYYPACHLVWGGGWMAQAGVLDFAELAAQITTCDITREDGGAIGWVPTGDARAAAAAADDGDELVASDGVLPEPMPSRPRWRGSRPSL